MNCLKTNHKVWITQSNSPEPFLVRIHCNISDVIQKSLEGLLYSGLVMLEPGK